MKITISQKNIDDANQSFHDRYENYCWHCPVEFALLEVGYLDPKVGSTVAEFIDENQKEVIFHLSDELQEQIMSWDSKDTFVPGEYELLE